MHIHREGDGTEGHCQRTIFRVLGLSNAAIWSGPLVVVLRQGQGSNARTRRWFTAGSLRFLQAAVIVAVLRGVLQVLHRVGGGESHSPMGLLKKQGEDSEWISSTQVKYFFNSTPPLSFDDSMETLSRLYGNSYSSQHYHLKLLSELCWPHKVHCSKVEKIALNIKHSSILNSLLHLYYSADYIR